MKILFIRPPVPPHTIGLKHIMICEPLELEYAAACLDGHELMIMDMIVEKGLKKRLREFQPDVVASSCYITGVNEVIKVFRQVKLWNKDCFTIAGGVQASQVPEDFGDYAVDLIVRGDGTSVMPEVIQALEDGTSLYDIPGLAFPVGYREVEKTKDRHYMPKADELPLPRRDLVAHIAHKYYYLMHQPVATMKTTWGCWYKCNFCFTWKITDGHPYSRSAESIIRELESIEAEDVYIVDDIFLINRSRLNKMATMIREKGIKKKYLCYARADFIAKNEDIIAEWAELGLHAVFIGLEAATNPELDSMDKESTVDYNVQAVEMLRKYKVDTYGSLIPNPDYTQEDWDNLWQFIKKIGLYYVNISPLTPMPGTLIWDKYKDQTTVPREAHGLWDLSHVLLPTRMPLKKFYRNLFKLYGKTFLTFSRGKQVTQRTLPSMWSVKYFKLLIGAFKIGRSLYTAHLHHTPRHLKKAMYRGPEVPGLEYKPRQLAEPIPLPKTRKDKAPAAKVADHHNGSIVKPISPQVGGLPTTLLHDQPNFMPPKGSLLDTVAGNRFFGELQQAQGEGYYSYQMPTSKKASPEVVINGQEKVSMSSYDYLGLIGHPKIEEASTKAIEQYGTGTGGVRLLTGTNELHLELERTIARFKGTDAAISFTSGYMANLAVISALIGRHDVVYADNRIHRSILDALNLAQVKFKTFRHNDLDHLESLLAKREEHARTFIITEGVFSMDGDIGDIPSIVELKNKYGAFLIVDEAHSLGVLGDSGKGAHEHFGMAARDVDIWTGSLSKAIPAVGGFVAGSKEMVVYLQHVSSPFIFSAALAPAASAAAKAAIEVMQEETWRIKELRNNTRMLAEMLHEEEFNTGTSSSAVIPLITGDDLRTHRLSNYLLRNGLVATPVVFPAVPKDSARLRLCASAAHTPEMYNRFVRTLLEFPEHHALAKAVNS